MHSLTPPNSSVCESNHGCCMRFTTPLDTVASFSKPTLTGLDSKASTASTTSQITRRRTTSPAQANQLYTFLWGQLYNGEIAHRYGKQPTPACRLCGLPDSCTDIAGTCPAGQHSPHHQETQRRCSAGPCSHPQGQQRRRRPPQIPPRSTLLRRRNNRSDDPPTTSRPITLPGTPSPSDTGQGHRPPPRPPRPYLFRPHLVP